MSVALKHNSCRDSVQWNKPVLVTSACSLLIKRLKTNSMTGKCCMFQTSELFLAVKMDVFSQVRILFLATQFDNSCNLDIHFVYVYQQQLQNYVNMSSPATPYPQTPSIAFVCSYHCVTIAMGAAHISPARPVIKLKVSSINHARPLPATERGFCKSPAGAAKREGSGAEGVGARAALDTQTHYKELSCFSTPASVLLPSQYSRQELQFSREELPTAVDCKIRPVD